MTLVLVLLSWASPLCSQVTWNTSNYPLPGPCQLVSQGATRGALLYLQDPVGAAGTVNPMWSWDGQGWTRLFPAVSPGARRGASLAYDSARDRVVLFGGHPTFQQSGLSDTWEWDGVNWMVRSPALRPPGRGSSAMAYDSWRGRSVLFGGHDGSDRSDTWEWDGSSWVQLAPSLSPPARKGHALVFDPVRGRTVLFGGSGAPADTWEWDGTSWTQRSPSISPSTRYGSAAAFDRVRGVLLLHGGVDGSTKLSDTWSWDGTTWSKATAATDPGARFGHGMVFDNQRGKCLLFGGAYSDTWDWNGSAWTQIAPARCPPGNVGALAFDEVRGHTLFYDGGSSLWQWNGIAWLEKPAPNAPPPRGGAALARDTRRDRLVLFGGVSGAARLNDTWEWDGARWLPMSPAASPSPRVECLMAFDSKRGRAVLFGGWDTGRLRETWEWDGTAWMQMALGPAWQDLNGMAYDSKRGRTVLLLAFYGPPSRIETWEWDGVSWSQRQPTTTPPYQYGCPLAFDSRRERTVSAYAPYNSTLGTGVYEWDGSNWTKRTPPEYPPTLFSHHLCYDSWRGRMVLFGGGGIGSNFAVWEYGPLYSASYNPFGSGCTGSAGMPILAAQGQGPWSGDTFTVGLSQLPAFAYATLLFGSSQSKWESHVLPFDLGQIGMPGCTLLSSGQIAVGLSVQAGQARLSFSIPSSTQLVGGVFYNQGVVADPMLNPPGLIVSNGAAASIGAK